MSYRSVVGTQCRAIKRPVNAVVSVINASVGDGVIARVIMTSLTGACAVVYGAVAALASPMP